MPDVARENRKFAAVVGAGEDDTICEILRGAVRQVGVPGIQIYPNPGAEELVRELKQHKHLGLERTLVVICSTDAFAAESVEWSVRKIKECRPAAWIMVYAAPIEDSGAPALNCIAAGASDYIVRMSLDAGEIGERLGRAITDGPDYCPYSRFAEMGQLKSPSVFVATPFSLPGRREYFHGIHPALKSLRIRHQISNEEHLTKSLLQGLTHQIDRHEVFIANLSSFGVPPSPPNANVYFELGYALGRSKKILLLRRQDSADVVSDLQGTMRLQHLNCADLALKMFFGFGRLLRHNVGSPKSQKTAQRTSGNRTGTP